MSQTYQLPIGPKGEVSAVFPDRCANCGKTAETESRLSFSRQMPVNKQRTRLVEVKIRIPHCQRCAQATKTLFLAGFIPFALGVVLVGVATFVVVMFYTSTLGIDEATQPGQTPGSWVLGGAAALLAGLAAGFVFEFIARILLIPVWGLALWHAPLLTWQFITDSDYVAGVKGQPLSDFSAVQLTFFNDEVAGEFARLNRSPVSPAV